MKHPHWFNNQMYDDVYNHTKTHSIANFYCLATSFHLQYMSSSGHCTRRTHSKSKRHELGDLPLHIKNTFKTNVQCKTVKSVATQDI